METSLIRISMEDADPGSKKTEIKLMVSEVKTLPEEQKYGTGKDKKNTVEDISSLFLI